VVVSPADGRGLMSRWRRLMVLCDLVLGAIDHCRLYIDGFLASHNVFCHPLCSSFPFLSARSNEGVGDFAYEGYES
jgi:hypothetical protein